MGHLWQRLSRRLLRAEIRPGRPSAARRAAAVTVRPQPDRPGPRAGDHTGAARIEYGPVADGDADPGEVVWAWVPFEEDHTRGKDRPVLVVARDGGHLLALMMTSKDHDRNAAEEARWGRVWLDIGSGAWDGRGRPSEVRLDRVLRLAPRAVRREGAHLDRVRFDEVAAALRRLHGWT